ncbi:MAG: hypothetical protein IJU49_06440 [Lachnospiraceae bacterium]|nr:hypothetical protein [Lachnospiraceae bacterium]
MKYSFRNNFMIRIAAGILAILLVVLCLLVKTPEVLADWSSYYSTGQCNYSPAVSSADQIDACFPESYRSSLKGLLQAHPNWSFKAMYTGFTWARLFDHTADPAYSAMYPNKAQSYYTETYPNRNLVYYANTSNLGITLAWYSTDIEGAYNWASNSWVPKDSGKWYQASEAAMAYCMDPRNFLTEEQIFQFFDGSNRIGSDESAVIPLIENIFRTTGNTFWLQDRESADVWDYYEEIEVTEAPTESESESETESEEPTESSEPEIMIVYHYMTYAEAIAKACAEVGINEAMVTARLLQEQGNGGSPLISGESGYYNYFNMGAGGSSQAEIIANGLQEARNEGWDTRWKALYGGIQKFAKKLVKAGQPTLYTQKFNVDSASTRSLWGQYMQNLTAPQTECRTLRNMLSTVTSTAPAVFVIPVFKDMPAAVCQRPTDNRNPNYKLGSIYVNGTSLSGFNMDKTEYGNVNVGTSSTATLDVMAYAPTSKVNIKVTFDGTETAPNVSYASDKRYSQVTVALGIGTSTVEVTCVAENESTRTYRFTLTREQGETPTEPPTEPTAPPTEPPTESGSEQPGGLGPGDINQDGKINIMDIGIQRDSILSRRTLTNIEFGLADVDSDQRISILDIGILRDYILQRIDKIVKP